MHCDVIAQGVINASKLLKSNIPIVVRLSGTNEAVGKEILAKSGLALHPAETFDEGARLAVKLAKEGATVTPPA